MRVVFHPIASEEIIETTAYYEGEVPGLGDRFITEVDKITEILCDQPNIGQSVGEEFRRILPVDSPVV